MKKPTITKTRFDYLRIFSRVEEGDIIKRSILVYGKRPAKVVSKFDEEKHMITMETVEYNYMFILDLYFFTFQISFNL